MNLLKAELDRLLSRRFLQILVVVLFAVFGLTVAAVLVGSDVPSDSDWVFAQTQAAAERDYQARALTECMERGGQHDCSVFDPGRVKTEQYLPNAFVFAYSIDTLLGFLAAYLGLFGFLIAASFVGAEMSSGGMTNLLLWQPERTRVLRAKLAVVLGAIGTIGVVFSALYIGVFYLVSAITGWTGQPVWDEIVLLAVRCVLLAMASAAIAFALSTIARNTVAAVGVLFGYMVVWEAAIRIMFTVTSRMDTDHPVWFLSTYAIAWVTGSYQYYDHDCGVLMDFSGDCSRAISWWHGGVVLGVVVAALLAFATLHFRKRDFA